MFYLLDLLRTMAQGTASQIALRDCSEEVREEPGYIGVFAKTKQNKQKTPQDVVEHKKITATLAATRESPCAATKTQCSQK